MNDNLDRLRHGWHPRKNAAWFWWVGADLIALCGIIKAIIRARGR